MFVFPPPRAALEAPPPARSCHRSRGWGSGSAAAFLAPSGQDAQPALVPVAEVHRDSRSGAGFGIDDLVAAIFRPGVAVAPALLLQRVGDLVDRLLVMVVPQHELVETAAAVAADQVERSLVRACALQL